LKAVYRSYFLAIEAEITFFSASIIVEGAGDF
jgi:hypothetical protein